MRFKTSRSVSLAKVSIFINMDRVGSALYPLAYCAVGVSAFLFVTERDLAKLWANSWENEKAVIEDRIVSYKGNKKMLVQYGTWLALVDKEIRRHEQWKRSWNPFYRWTTDPIQRYDMRWDEIDQEARRRARFV